MFERCPFSLLPTPFLPIIMIVRFSLSLSLPVYVQSLPMNGELHLSSNDWKAGERERDSRETSVSEFFCCFFLCNQCVLQPVSVCVRASLEMLSGLLLGVHVPISSLLFHSSLSVCLLVVAGGTQPIYPASSIKIFFSVFSIKSAVSVFHSFSSSFLPYPYHSFFLLLISLSCEFIHVHSLTPLSLS